MRLLTNSLIRIKETLGVLLNGEEGEEDGQEVEEVDKTKVLAPFISELNKKYWEIHGDE